MGDVDQLRAAYAAAEQSHVFSFWDTCSAEEQQRLLAQLRAVDPARVNQIYDAVRAAEQAGTPADVEPVTADAIVATADAAQRESWRAAATGAVRSGELGVLLLAGGQGTRLGSPDPKGMYNIGLPSGKSLFQLQAEKMHSLQRLAAAPDGGAVPTVPWYVMTSDATRAKTEAFFEAHGFFGLQRDQVFFFDQGWLPALTPEGKFVMESRCALATAPDGNGGVYAALSASGALADMERRGVRYVHVYCVDNALARVGDPDLVGACIQAGADVGSKVVRKAAPEEAVGVYGTRGGRRCVVEYSELPAGMATAVDAATGRLLFDAANIAQHFFSLPFLRRCCGAELQARLVYHKALKKVPCAAPDGSGPHAPAAPNALKLETFIFDVMPFADAERVFLLEGARAEDFAPVKNAEGAGKDSPDTARALVGALHRRWVEAAGGSVSGDGVVEVSGLLSFEGEGLAARCSGRTFAPPCEVA